ncbi:rod shape-determining protein MreC [Pedococcus cremeus]|uniref:Cell shape-determining protein MreC n=1 Tax=Pedococcus cremeus TaxID=587636 RepID=A0A1H9UUI7_9MICO|nr:rod shape-determining protein MreC [Pedococcus cremeus]SES12717.1 rod shape-determining protein MreC [Pedococcus cremeus]
MRRRPSRRRLLVALLAATLVVVVADVSGWSATDRVRALGATVLGPLERVAGRGGGAALAASDSRAARTRLGYDAAVDARTTEEARQLRALLDSPGATGARLVPARVVAVGSQGAAGPERVTIDVGSRDGVTADRTVVNADGLVGRVVATGPWTSDVLLVGSADLAVGVRVGSAGTLGSLTGATGATGDTGATGMTGASGVRPRPAGQLDLQLVQRGSVAVGDAVTTMGSTGGRPFVAGVPVGRVSSVDPGGGRFAPTAAVQPSVDVTRLDVVGVLLTAPRTTPRTAVEGTAR